MAKYADVFGDESVSYVWYPTYRSGKIILGKVYPSPVAKNLNPFTLGLNALVRQSGCIDRILVVHERDKLTILAFITADNVGHVQTLAYRLSNTLKDIYGGQTTVQSFSSSRQSKRLLCQT